MTMPCPNNPTALLDINMNDPGSIAMDMCSRVPHFTTARPPVDMRLVEIIHMLVVSDDSTHFIANWL